MNKVDEFLARPVSKMKSHIRNIRNERLDTTTLPIDISLVKEYH